MNTETFFDIIERYSTLLPLIVFFLKKSNKEVWVILLLVYLFLYFFFLSIFDPFIYDKPNNIVVYIIVAIFTFCLFSSILERILQQKKFAIVNRIVMVITVLFFLNNAIWGEGISAFNSISGGLANLIIVCYCLYYFKFQFEDPKIIFITNQPSFWAVSGIFIYSAGNFFLFALYNTLTIENSDFAYYAWYVNDIFILVMNIFFSKSMYCNWIR